MLYLKKKWTQKFKNHAMVMVLNKYPKLLSNFVKHIALNNNFLCHTYEKNKVAEYKNKILFKTVRCKLQHKQLHNVFLTKAINTQTYVLNCAFTTIIEEKISKEVWSCITSLIQYLCIF